MKKLLSVCLMAFAVVAYGQGVRISELPSKTTASDVAVLPIVVDGDTWKVSIGDLFKARTLVEAGTVNATAVNTSGLNVSATTANTLLQSSGTKQVLSIPNGAGVLTNTGAGVFTWVPVTSPFSMVAGNLITLITNGTVVTIASAGEPAFTLLGGSNTTLSTNGTDVTIDVSVPASGEVNTASNVGTGQGVYSTKVGADIRLRSIAGAGGLTASTESDTITVGSTGNLSQWNAIGTNALTSYLLLSGGTVTGPVTFTGGVTFDSGPGTVNAQDHLYVTNNVMAYIAAGGVAIDALKASATNNVTAALTFEHVTNGAHLTDMSHVRWLFNGSGSDQTLTIPSGWRTNLYSPVPTKVTNAMITRMVLSVNGPTDTAARQTNVYVSFEYYK